jgi:diadenosine tetraphosphate (Ap4A) HIT family hydrolase
MKADSAVCGFNIGTNNGSEAGQTISHCHLHLIPRRKGDIDDPRGGVRGVIRDKRVY